MNKFTGPTKIPTYDPKSKTTTTRHFSSSNHSSTTSGGQTTSSTTRASSSHVMTYSALPKPQEPPVNSAEYYRLMQQGAISNTPSNIQQSAAPPHIQGPAPGFGALRDRFKRESLSESTNSPQDMRRQQQATTSNTGLSSLRDHYMNQAKESVQHQEESFSQRIQHVSRSIVGEDLPSSQSSQQQQHQPPAAPPSTPQVSQQEEALTPSQITDDQPVSSEGAVADGSSLSGASSLENDPTLTATDAPPVEEISSA